MTILVTGATGFVGSAVVRALGARGLDWRALVRDEQKARALSIPRDRIVLGDLAGDAKAYLRGIDSVLHIAGLVRGSSAELDAVNIGGTRRLAEAFEESCAGRFVLVSSLAATGPSIDGAASACDVDAAMPVSDYGRSKLGGERVVREIVSRWLTLRPGIVYGPRDTDVFVLFKMASRGVLPIVGRKSRFSMLHVDDLALCTLAALDAPLEACGRAYPAVHEEVLQQDDWLRRIARAVGRDARLVAMPRAFAWISAAAGEVAGRIRGRAPLFGFDKFREMKGGSWVGDPAPARTALGWSARIGHDDGFARSVAWYREHAWLPARPAARGERGASR